MPMESASANLVTKYCHVVVTICLPWWLIHGGRKVRREHCHEIEANGGGTACDRTKSEQGEHIIACSRFHYSWLFSLSNRFGYRRAAVRKLVASNQCYFDGGSLLLSHHPQGI